MKELIGKKPVVLDREFSYEGLFEDFVEEGTNFVILLNAGIRPLLMDKKWDGVKLSPSSVA